MFIESYKKEENIDINMGSYICVKDDELFLFIYKKNDNDNNYTVDMFTNDNKVTKQFTKEDVYKILLNNNMVNILESTYDDIEDFTLKAKITMTEYNYYIEFSKLKLHINKEMLIEDSVKDWFCYPCIPKLL
jgi:hypothetical protein